MRLSRNMATGKGLAAILGPKTINLIGSNKLNKFPRGVLRQCSACQRHVVTVASAVGGWNPEKSKVHPLALDPRWITSLACFPTRLRSRRFRRCVSDLLACRVDVPLTDCPSFHPLRVSHRPIRAARNVYPMR